MSNPAKIDDPGEREQAIRTGQNINANYTKPIVQTTDTTKEPIVGPSAPKDAEFWSTFSEKTERPDEVQAIYTVSDHERFEAYKKKQLEQLQGETLKQSIREMYDQFKNARNFAEMQYLEREFPFLVEEKQQYVQLQQWALEMLGEYYSTGGKPTKRMIEFIYAAKTDPNLAAIVDNLNKAFETRGPEFGTTEWREGWLSSYIMPKVFTTAAPLKFTANNDALLLQASGVKNADYWSPMQKGDPKKSKFVTSTDLKKIFI